MVEYRKRSVLRIAVLWRGTLLREATLDNGKTGCERGGPFYDLAIPGLERHHAYPFRRVGRGEWGLRWTSDLSGTLCLDGHTGPLQQTKDPTGDDPSNTIRLAPGDWGLLDLGPVTLFFQVQQVPPLPRRRIITPGTGRLAASVVAAAFLAVTLMVVSGLNWEPVVRERSRAATARPMRVVANVAPPKAPDILKIKEDTPDPLRHERLKFGHQEEPKPRQIARPAPRKKAKPLRPAHVVMTEDSGGDWAGEGGGSGGFDLPGATTAAFVPLAPRPQAPPPAPKVDIAQLTRDYLQKVREELGLKKVYPLAAQRMGAAGAVSLSFVVLPDGTFSDVRIKRSSGNDLLDQAALQTLAALSGKIRRPHQIGSHPLKTSVVLRYELG